MLSQISNSLPFPLSSQPNLKTAAGTLAVGLSLPLAVLAESGQDALGSAGELLATYLTPAVLFTGIVIVAGTVFLCCRNPTTASDEDTPYLQQRAVFELAQAGDVVALQEALDGKFGLNQTDGAGQTLLHHACVFGSESVVSFLLERGANPNTRSILALGEGTPLTAACMKGHYQIAQLLLEKGAKVSANDRELLLPLLSNQLQGFAVDSAEFEAICNINSKLRCMDPMDLMDVFVH